MIKVVGTDSPVVLYLMKDVIDWATFVACVATVAAVIFTFLGAANLYDNIKATYLLKTAYGNGHKVSTREWVATGVLVVGAIVLTVIAVPTFQVVSWSEAYDRIEKQYIQEIKPALERMEVACTDDDIKKVSTYIEKWNSEASKHGKEFFTKNSKDSFALMKAVEILGDYEGYNVIANANYDNIKVVLSSKVRENIQATGKYVVEDVRPAGDSLDSK